MTIKRSVNLEFVLQDMWIGLFWRKSSGRFDLWICLIPCIPIHYSICREECSHEPLLPIERRHLTARSVAYPKTGWYTNGNEFTRSIHHS